MFRGGKLRAAVTGPGEQGSGGSPLDLATRVLRELVELDDFHFHSLTFSIAIAVRQLDLDSDSEAYRIEVRDRNGTLRSSFSARERVNALRFSPEGRAIAYSTKNRGVAELHIVDIESGSDRVIYSASAILGAPAFSPDGQEIAIHAVPSATRGSGVQRFSGLPVHHQGMPPPDTRLALVSLAGTPVREVSLPGSDCAWHPDGKSLAVVVPGLVDGLPAAGLSTVRTDGEHHLVHTGLRWLACPAFSPSGRKVAFAGTRELIPAPGHPVMRPWVLDLDGGGPARRVSDCVVISQRTPGADSGLQWRDEWSLVVRTGRNGSIGLTRIRLDGPESSIVDGEEQVTHFGLSQDGVVYSTASASVPWAIREAGSREEPRTVFAPNGEMQDWLSSLETVQRWFSGHRDYSVAGLVIRSRTRRSRRLLVSMHGGPHGFVGPTISQTHMYRWLAAARGWTVLALDPSGSGTYSDEHTSRIRGQWGRIDLEETLDAIDTLCVEGLVSREQVAVSGFSYGGFLAAAALATTRRFRCGTIGAPVANLQTWFATSDIGSSFLGWEYEWDRPDFWARLREASPVHVANRIEAPVLVFQGMADVRCPPSQSMELHAAMSGRRTVSAGLALYERGTHSFPADGRPSHRTSYHSSVIDFIEQHLPLG